MTCISGPPWTPGNTPRSRSFAYFSRQRTSPARGPRSVLTTHKTLRGPRAGLVLCREKYAKDLDRGVFPGVQGGPLMHVIAAKAVCFKEAMEPSFGEYQ